MINNQQTKPLTDGICSAHSSLVENMDKTAGTSRWEQEKQSDNQFFLLPHSLKGFINLAYGWRSTRHYQQDDNLLELCPLI